MDGTRKLQFFSVALEQSVKRLEFRYADNPGLIVIIRIFYRSKVDGQDGLRAVIQQITRSNLHIYEITGIEEVVSNMFNKLPFSGSYGYRY